MDLRVRTGDQASLRMSRQIAPEAEEMFGWYTFVMNFILTGWKGYESGMTMSSMSEILLSWMKAGCNAPTHHLEVPALIRCIFRTIERSPQMKWGVIDEVDGDVRRSIILTICNNQSTVSYTRSRAPRECRCEHGVLITRCLLTCDLFVYPSQSCIHVGVV